MKNKKNIYILLPAVLIIWGLLGYQIFSAVGPKKLALQTQVAGTFKPESFKEAEAFTINIDYRDPFLGTRAKPKVIRSKKKKVVKKPVVTFPKIVYKGLISSNTKKGRVFLISINGKQHFFKKNAIQNEVKLIKGNAKEIVVLFHGQRQTIKLGQ